MTPQRLKEALRGGETIFGTLIVSTSPKWLEAVNGAGLDFVFIDTEHISIDRAQLHWMCAAYTGAGLPPIVRIPSPDPYAATMVQDSGAAGVIAPYIETVEQVQALRGALKLRPLKGAKLAGLLAGEPGDAALGEYMERAAAPRTLIVNIESVPAMNVLDQLVAVPGLDAVLIGPHDLSCSLDVPEQYEHPRFLQACETIFQTARRAGLGAGIHFWGDTAQQVRLLNMGANMLIHSADITLFKKHLRLELDAVKQAAGLRSSAGGAGPLHV